MAVNEVGQREENGRCRLGIMVDAQDLGQSRFGGDQIWTLAPTGFAELDEMLIGNRLSLPGCAPLNSDMSSEAQHHQCSLNWSLMLSTCV